MTNKFKIISEDGLKTLCKAIKKTSTVGEIIDDANSVTDKTYSSFEIDRRLNTKANDSEVVKKTDIVDNLTSTDTDKPLSANQGKILNDTKLNKTDANKWNCVSIDNVSIKEYILTNFTEREKTYYLIAKTTCTDLPKASNFYITVETPGLYTYKVTAKELNDSNGMYVSTYRTISSSWTAWQKVCTTTVADVPFTPITFKDSNIVSLGNSGYCVNNGWCHLVLEIQFNADMSFGWKGITNCNIPIPKTSQRTTKMILNSTTVPVKSIVCGVQGELVLFGSASNTEQYFGSVSYPVAE